MSEFLFPFKAKRKALKLQNEQWKGVLLPNGQTDGIADICTLKIDRKRKVLTFIFSIYKFAGGTF